MPNFNALYKARLFVILQNKVYGQYLKYIFGRIF